MSSPVPGVKQICRLYSQHSLSYSSHYFVMKSILTTVLLASILLACVPKRQVEAGFTFNRCRIFCDPLFHPSYVAHSCPGGCSCKSRAVYQRISCFTASGVVNYKKNNARCRAQLRNPNGSYTQCPWGDSYPA